MANRQHVCLRNAAEVPDEPIFLWQQPFIVVLPVLILIIVVIRWPKKPIFHRLMKFPSVCEVIQLAMVSGISSAAKCVGQHG